MHVKTMEGLAGAGKNMELLKTPMRVFREARREGNQAKMERAMRYAGEISDKAREYKTEAEEGMKEEAEEIREAKQAACEQALEAQRDEQKEQKEPASGQNLPDSLEISEEGKRLLRDQMEQEGAKEAVTYVRTGTGNQAQPEARVSVTV